MKEMQHQISTSYLAKEYFSFTEHGRFFKTQRIRFDTPKLKPDDLAPEGDFFVDPYHTPHNKIPTFVNLSAFSATIRLQQIISEIQIDLFDWISAVDSLQSRVNTQFKTAIQTERTLKNN